MGRPFVPSPFLPLPEPVQPIPRHTFDRRTSLCTKPPPVPSPSLPPRPFPPCAHSNDPTTFDSQSTFVLPYTRADGSVLYIYCGDRWNDAGPGGLLNSTYIWLPFHQGPNGDWNLTWYDSWRIGDF